jgi:hypothetical protein
MDAFLCDHNDTTAEVPMEGLWIVLDDLKKINGVSHGVGGCPPQQGACKLTLNVKNGVIEEALIETVGCSGITQSATIVSEILVGLNLLEALNTHLVCDAINIAMKQAFIQFVYGRTQTAFSKNGLPVGSLVDELATNKLSHVGTVLSIKQKTPLLLQSTEGIVTNLALDEEGNIIGYLCLKIGEFLSAMESSQNCNISDFMIEYGRYKDGVHFLNTREAI